MGESVVLHTTKLNNRRVSLGRLNNGDWAVRFKMLTDDRKPRVTQFILSDEAMDAFIELHDELTEVSRKEFQSEILDKVASAFGLSPGLLGEERANPPWSALKASMQMAGPQYGCKVLRENDELVCHSCGHRWGVGESDRECPQASVSPAQRILKELEDG